jgi:hypothetical protein
VTTSSLALLRELQSDPIDVDDPELREAVRIHRLQWADRG